MVLGVAPVGLFFVLAPQLIDTGLASWADLALPVSLWLVPVLLAMRRPFDGPAALACAGVATFATRAFSVETSYYSLLPVVAAVAPAAAPVLARLYRNPPPRLSAFAQSVAKGFAAGYGALCVVLSAAVEGLTRGVAHILRLVTRTRGPVPDTGLG